MFLYMHTSWDTTQAGGDARATVEGVYMQMAELCWGSVQESLATYKDAVTDYKVEKQVCFAGGRSVIDGRLVN